MAEFMVLMKGSGGSSEQWSTYIETLNASGAFRGGSELGNGRSIGGDPTDLCTVSGFMRFDANSIEAVIELMQGNPLLSSGGVLEVMQLLETQ